MADNEKVRLNFDVSPNVNEILEKISREAGVTKAESLRKAIALLMVVSEGRQEGKKLALVDANNEIDTLIVGI